MGMDEKQYTHLTNAPDIAATPTNGTMTKDCQCITYTYVTTTTTFSHHTLADPRLEYAYLKTHGLVTSPLHVTRTITQRRYDPMRNTITDHEPFTGDLSTVGPLNYRTRTISFKLSFPDYLAPFKWIGRGCGKPGVVVLGSCISTALMLTGLCIGALEHVAAGLEGFLVAIRYTSI
jgi:hypothetical protein